MKEKCRCPFCDTSDDVLFETELVIIRRDLFPISPGHLLIIPKRHIQTWFDADNTEQIALVHALNLAKQYLAKEYQPDGYNIGINCGVAAGQTVQHLHVHLIPRYSGDISDPRGGVRWIIPDKAIYW